MNNNLLYNKFQNDVATGLIDKQACLNAIYYFDDETKPKTELHSLLTQAKKLLDSIILYKDSLYLQKLEKLNQLNEQLRQHYKIDIYYIQDYTIVQHLKNLDNLDDFDFSNIFNKKQR